jgi:IS30 family transposase
MKTYKKLNKSEREMIYELLHQNMSLRNIAGALNRNVSTISREINKNHGKHYKPHKAHERAIENQVNSHKKERLKTHALRIEVETMISTNKWSPEIVAGRLKRLRPDLPYISHEAIYQYIYSDAPHLIDCLVRSHPNRWPKGKSKHCRIRIPDRVSITQRPAYINNRLDPGHWEADLIISKGHSSIQVLVERKSRLTKIVRIPNKSAPSASSAICSVLSTIPQPLRKSITYDNGLENVLHSNINDSLGTTSFFCQPYHSWEKGTIENTNGLIRRFLPKSSNFDTISIDSIRQVESWLNNRPRKCLNFLTPTEAFNSYCCT